MNSEKPKISQQFQWPSKKELLIAASIFVSLPICVLGGAIVIISKEARQEISKLFSSEDPKTATSAVLADEAIDTIKPAQTTDTGIDFRIIPEKKEEDDNNWGDDSGEDKRELWCEPK